MTVTWLQPKHMQWHMYNTRVWCDQNLFLSVFFRRYLTRNNWFWGCDENQMYWRLVFLLSLQLFEWIFQISIIMYNYVLNYFNLSPAGLSMHTFHGNFFVRSTDLLTLPNVNPDHGFCMNISIDENLKEYNNVCLHRGWWPSSWIGYLVLYILCLCLTDH